MNKATKRFTVVIGIVMSVAMVGSLLIPLFSGQVGYTENLNETPQPTPLPEPTFPPPPDVSAIDFDQLLLHPSGLFTVAVPSGWQSASHSNTADELRAGLSNSEAHSVIEARIIKNPGGISESGELSAFFSRDWLGQTWRDYLELGRNQPQDQRGRQRRHRLQLAALAHALYRSASVLAAGWRYIQRARRDG